jgi:hypothetical protein
MQQWHSGARGARTRIAVAAIRGACLAAPALAAAAAGAEPPSAWAIGVYRGRGVTEDFYQVAAQAPFGRVTTVDSFETGVFAMADITPDGWRGGTGPFRPRAQAALQLYQASGLRNNRAFAIDWRPSVSATTGGGLRTELGIGIGWWHACGTPWYHHHGSPEMDSEYHNLLHLVPEVAFRHEALPGWSIGVRIDHASGAYGLLAPKALGTNHVGVVLARDL